MARFLGGMSMLCTGFYTDRTERSNRRVFGNKRGKVIIDYTVEEERSGENRRKFLERQAARKAAALKVAEARRQSMAGTYLLAYGN